MRRLDEKGSVLVFLTLGIALLGAFIGLSVDLGKSYLQRARMSRLVDGAALAAAKVLKGQAGYEAAATQAACDSMVMNGAKVKVDGAGKCSSVAGPKFTVNLAFVDRDVPGGPPMKFVQVTGVEDMPTHFMGLISLMAPGDFSKIKVAVTAEAGPERPVDLMLVLDRSGSMSGATGVPGVSKIAALRTSVNEFLDNSFGADDRIGLVSFSSRGCGNASGQDSTVDGPCSPDIPIDDATTTHIDRIRSRVNALNANGYTNTMEAIRTARGPLAQAFNDSKRATTRKVMLLITDGQPTAMRIDNDKECHESPITGGASLPYPGDQGSFANGCRFGAVNSSRMERGPLTNSSWNAIGSGAAGAQLFKDTIRCTRSLINCDTNGAMHEANLLRNCGYNNSACVAGGDHDVLVFVIAIGKEDKSTPNSSLDQNAKCLLARIANAAEIENADTRVVETMVDNCNNKYTTIDGDTHADLAEGFPCPAGLAPCIDGTQQKGKVYTINLQGDVTDQLRLVFNEITAILKLRLTM